MKYEDVLEECLQARSAGRDIEPLLARYPQFAERLRQDLALASTIGSLPATLPPVGRAASQRLEQQLAQARLQRQSRPSRWGSLLPRAGMAAAVAAALVIAAMAFGLGRGLPGNTAEASTLEGVVVDNAGGILTLQTETGLQQVSLADGASLQDDGGLKLELNGIQAGELLKVQGKRTGSATLVARQVNRQTAQSLQEWCLAHGLPCQELAQRLEQGLNACAQDSTACQGIRARLQALHGDLASLARLHDLQTSCEQGRPEACRQVGEFCSQRPVACRAIAGWLRSHRIDAK